MHNVPPLVNPFRSPTDSIAPAYRTAGGDSKHICKTKVGHPPRTLQFLMFPMSGNYRSTYSGSWGRCGSPDFHTALHHALMPSASDAANSSLRANSKASCAVSLTVTPGLCSTTCSRCTSGTATKLSIFTLISILTPRCASMLDGEGGVFLRRSCVRRSHPCIGSDR